MKPSNKITIIADEILKLHPEMNVSDAILHAILIHIDREYSDKKEEPIKFNGVKNQRDNNIHVDIKCGEKKLHLEIHQDADIFVWERNIRKMLEWLTFQKSTINEILVAEEPGA